MENIEENVVTKGAAKADPMPSSGIPVEDLGGPTPENYKPDDDSAKLKDPALTLAQVKDVVPFSVQVSQGCILLNQEIYEFNVTV